MATSVRNDVTERIIRIDFLPDCLVRETIMRVGSYTPPEYYTRTRLQTRKEARQRRALWDLGT